MPALAFGAVLAAALISLTIAIVSGRGENREAMRRRLPWNHWR